MQKIHQISDEKLAKEPLPYAFALMSIFRLLRKWDQRSCMPAVESNWKEEFEKRKDPMARHILVDWHLPEPWARIARYYEWHLQIITYRLFCYCRYDCPCTWWLKKRFKKWNWTEKYDKFLLTDSVLFSFCTLYSWLQRNPSCTHGFGNSDASIVIINYFGLPQYT